MSCNKCSYLGCDFARNKYGQTLGHYVWTIDLRTRWRRWANPLYAYKQLKCWWTALDYSKIDDIELDGINTRDYPDFCDAYIASATYKGRDMTDAELDRLNEDTDYVHAKVIDRLY